MRPTRAKLTSEDFNALSSLVDLASGTIADAEHDHKEWKNVSRRNGGYSKDLRIGLKALEKIRKIVESVVV